MSRREPSTTCISCRAGCTRTTACSRWTTTAASRAARCGARRHGRARERCAASHDRLAPRGATLLRRFLGAYQRHPSGVCRRRERVGAGACPAAGVCSARLERFRAVVGARQYRNRQAGRLLAVLRPRHRPHCGAAVLCPGGGGAGLQRRGAVLPGPVALGALRAQRHRSRRGPGHPPTEARQGPARDGARGRAP